MELLPLSPVILDMNSEGMECYRASQMVSGVPYHHVTSKVVQIKK